jgi:DNA-binding transcriptional MerR regulator
MSLYSAGEIVKKLHGVTTRQILDLAEKGLITPARETSGAGSPRLYNFQNIFDICICVAVRGRIPAGTATKELISNILNYIREETEISKKEKLDSPKGVARQIIKEQIAAAGFHNHQQALVGPPFDILFIAYDNRDNYSFSPVKLSEKLEEVLARSRKYRPQSYCTYILEVAALWKYLKTVF